ncbi:UDP-4-amino-4,6-dideoxy-N-acetyl-beta-L-altrosamine transaminase [Amylibacter sp.]|nr:UDP-4-amino-4,6-dideoxy-N-acetyl-beta-L-altrosamine transaminase [Amylibacter sp.]
MIPYGRQEITQEDIDSVEKVLRSDFLTQGPVVPKFEEIVSSYSNVKYAVAVNSATSALHIACMALGVGPGDFVWTSSITFVASANCALYCGAKVDFIDIDIGTYNFSINSLEEKLAKAKLQKKLPKVIIPVHMAGQSCDMEAIYKLSQKYGFKILEDASHAIGGKYNNEPVGKCSFSDITVFSFHPVKIITTAEGGMALTNSAYLAKRMQLFRSHGITNKEEYMQVKPEGELWNYQQLELGYNYRMTDLHAALGITQMQRLDKYVLKRQYIAKQYSKRLSSLPLITPHEPQYAYSSYHLYIIRLKLDEIKKSHKEVYNELRSMGILVNLHYIPVYRQPYFEKMGYNVGYCKNAERFFSEAISLPLYPGITENNLDFIISTLKSVL